jgi:membrane protease YdiL (CAAX protease family)
MSYFVYILIAILLIVILLLLTTVIGKFPEPLPLTKKPAKEIFEVLFLWTLNFVFLFVYIFYLGPYFYTLISDDVIPGVILFSFTSLIIPLLYVATINKWKIKDFGIINKVESWSVAFFGIISYFLIALISYFLFLQTSIPLNYLLIFLYSNAFLEEFFHRSILQSKLERVIGQNNSILYGGLLFGLIHIPANLYSFLIHQDLILTILTFGLQILRGWTYGIIYTKTRNLFPGILAHYITNWLGPIILLFL